MSRRSNVNAFSKEVIKGQIQPEEIFCNFPKPLNKIDDYVRESDRACLDLKRDLLKRMQASSQYTIKNSSKDSNSLADELPTSTNKRKCISVDYYLPGMPSVLMSVQRKYKKRQKKKTKSIDLSKIRGEGQDGASSDEDKEKEKKGQKDKKDQKGSGSESEAEERNVSNSSGDEAGDYANTYFDNGEDYLPSDNSGGDGDYY